MRALKSTACVALTFMALLAAVPATAGGPPPPAGWTDGYVMSNGIRIHYWRTGGTGKPALVLAHGSSDDALCWTNLATVFQDRYDIIMFDARGHGLSDPPTEADAADVQVEDLAGLIKALKLDKPILMGHSMGSASVAHFAAKYPDVPRAVILEDPALVRPATPPGAAPAAPWRSAWRTAADARGAPRHHAHAQQSERSGARGRLHEGFAQVGTERV
jgi:pimeloyl-ACP methyl ester carboxylesterase